MKWFLLIGASMTMLACAPAQQEVSLVGGQRDEQGCLPSAGYSWSVLKQQCIQPFEEADITLTDPDNHNLAIYVVLSEDKQQAEIFKADLPSGSIFEAVKGGYLSKDNQMRLMKQQSGWKFLKN